MKLHISARAYLILLLLSVCAAYVGLLYYFFENRIDDARDQALDEASLFASISAKAVDAWHADLSQQAQAVARRPEALAALAGAPCGGWLAQEVAERRYANAFVLNARREVVCSGIDPAKRSAPTKEAMAAQPMDKERASVGLFYPSGAGQWAFPVLFPIVGADGEIKGTLALAMGADRLDQLRGAITGTKDGAQLAYVDASGRVSIASGMGPMRTGEMASKDTMAAIRLLTSSPRHSGTLVDGSFAAANNAPYSGWRAFVVLPKQSVYGPLSDGIYHQTLVLAVFGLFAMFGIWGIANRLTSATNVLVRAAGNVDSLFSARSTGVSEIDRGLDEMKRNSREQAKAQTTIELWRAASERTRSGMAVLRVSRMPDGEASLAIVLCNPAFSELSMMGECVGKDLLAEAPAGSFFHDRAARQEIRACAGNSEQASRSGEATDSHGRPCHLQMSLEPLSIEGDRDLCCITLEDVTEIAEREAELEKQSTTDALTNLPNRALFTSLLSKSIAISNRNNSLCAVAMLDLDHFKFINDSIGHEMGDKVIAEVAGRLAARLRPGDTLSRFGGDEFAIVFADVPSLESIASLVEHARDALLEQVVMSGKPFALTFSAGVAVYPHDGAGTKELLSCADIAMFQAKETGRGNVKFHSKSMSEAFAERLDIEQALKGALQNDAISFLYQPKISLSTGMPCGMEALARWRHPVLGDISPSKFIPLAEESELIATLGDLAIKIALRDAKILWDQGFRNMPVAINVSARQIKEGFTEKLVRALRESGLPAQAVHVEITESSVMPNSEVTRQFLDELHRLDIKVALDDFGTGWSNMAMLKTLPLSYLKMDRSFIIGLGKDEKDAAIAKAIIGLARALNVQVIAEGVETHMQAQQLSFLSADQMQGYYICKPMPIEEVSRWLHSGYVFQGATAFGPSGVAAPAIAPLSILGPDAARPDRKD